MASLINLWNVTVELTPICHKTFQKGVPNLLCEGSIITVIPKLDNITRKLQTNIYVHCVYEYGNRNPQENISKPKSATYKKIIYHDLFKVVQHMKINQCNKLLVE